MQLQFVQNVPFFSIMLCMVSGIVSAMLPGRAAKWVTAALAATVAALNAWLTAFLAQYGQSYVYWMGHFPAPWGNELRAGLLEAVLAVGFSLIMLLSVLGGMRKMGEQVDPKKLNIVCVMLDLVLAAMMSMLYTNDLFTGYVFIEIMTLASCALIMSRQNGRTLVSAMRYMIMSLLGSGMTLIAITITYNLTGHLLMENIHESLAQLHASGEYATPITVITGLFFVGLGIKSALYPFHTWLPDAYGYSTPTASAVLSSIVSKAYIFLLIKIFYRVLGMELVRDNHALNLLFLFGIVGMIMGSVDAIFTTSGAWWPSAPWRKSATSTRAWAWAPRRALPPPSTTCLCTPAPRAPCSFPPPAWPTPPATASAFPTCAARASVTRPRAYALPLGP